MHVSSTLQEQLLKLIGPTVRALKELTLFTHFLFREFGSVYPFFFDVTWTLGLRALKVEGPDSWNSRNPFSNAGDWR